MEPELSGTQLPSGGGHPIGLSEASVGGMSVSKPEADVDNFVPLPTKNTETNSTENRKDLNDPKNERLATKQDEVNNVINVEESLEAKLVKEENASRVIASVLANWTHVTGEEAEKDMDDDDDMGTLVIDEGSAVQTEPIENVIKKKKKRTGFIGRKKKNRRSSSKTESLTADGESTPKRRRLSTSKPANEVSPQQQVDGTIVQSLRTSSCKRSLYFEASRTPRRSSWNGNGLLDDLSVKYGVFEPDHVPLVSPSSRQLERLASRRLSENESANTSSGSKLSCDICSKMFLSERGLKCHMQLHPDHSMKCSVCGTEFLRHRGLIMHKRMAHDNIESQSQSIEALDLNIGFGDLDFVDFSSRKFPLIAKALCEKTPHQPSSPFHDYSCTKCKKAFPCVSAFSMHNQSHEALSECLHCGSSFCNTLIAKIHSSKHANVKEGKKGVADWKDNFLASIGLHADDIVSKSKVLAEDQLKPQVQVRLDSGQNNTYFMQLQKFAMMEAEENEASTRNTVKAETDFAEISDILRTTSEVPSLSTRTAENLTTDRLMVKKAMQQMSSTKDKISASEKSSPVKLTPKVKKEQDFGKINAETNTPVHPSSEKKKRRKKYDKDKTFQCSICKSAFSERTNTERHIRLVHHVTDVKTAKGLVFLDEDIIGKSLEGQQNQTNLMCKYCLKMFTTSKSLKLHHKANPKGSCGPKPYLCSICDRGFSNKANCVRHIENLHRLDKGTDFSLYVKKKDIDRTIPSMNQLNTPSADSSKRDSGSHMQSSTVTSKTPTKPANHVSKASISSSNKTTKAPTNSANKGEHSNINNNNSTDNGMKVKQEPVFLDDYANDEPIDLTMPKEGNDLTNGKNVSVFNSSMCEYCGKNFTNYYELSKHTNEKHKDSIQDLSSVDQPETSLQMLSQPNTMMCAKLKRTRLPKTRLNSKGQRVDIKTKQTAKSDNPELATVKNIIGTANNNKFQSFLQQSAEDKVQDKMMKDNNSNDHLTNKKRMSTFDKEGMNKKVTVSSKTEEEYDSDGSLDFDFLQNGLGKRLLEDGPRKVTDTLLEDGPRKVTEKLQSTAFTSEINDVNVKNNENKTVTSTPAASPNSFAEDSNNEEESGNAKETDVKKTYTEQHSSLKHLRGHGQIVEDVYKCYLCETSFHDNQVCIQHLADFHSLDIMKLKSVQSEIKLKDKVNDNQSKLAGGDKSTPESVSEDEKNEISKHKGVKKVWCSFCDKTFWSIQDLRRHMRSHTGEQPFECDLCQKRFTLKHSMMRHYRVHHKAHQDQDPWETTSDLQHTENCNKAEAINKDENEVDMSGGNGGPLLEDLNGNSVTDASNLDLLGNLLGVENGQINKILDSAVKI